MILQMSTDDVFRERTRRFAGLVKTFKGQADAASELGFTTVQLVSNYKNGKNMGEETALRIEEMGKLPPGSLLNPLNTEWFLDEPEKPLDTGKKYSGNIAPSHGVSEREKGHYDVESYELWQGFVEKDARAMSIPKEWFEKEGYKPEQIKFITMPDDSQAGIVSKGFDIAINVNWNGEIKNNCYYGVVLGGTPTVRGLEYQYDGSLVLTCNNNKFKDQEVPEKDLEKLKEMIIGIPVKFQGNFPDY